MFWNIGRHTIGAAQTLFLYGAKCLAGTKSYETESHKNGSLTPVEVGDYSLKIHKSAYHLFSAFISKRGFFSANQKIIRRDFGRELPLP